MTAPRPHRPGQRARALLAAVALAGALTGVALLPAAAAGQTRPAQAPASTAPASTAPASTAQPPPTQPRARAVAIAGGTFTPFFAEPDTPTVTVGPFLLDATPVTNAQFAEFVAREPSWASGQPPAILASPLYLRGWGGRTAAEVASDTALGPRPVTFVSWFAASAYCSARGGRLPTEAEWELVGLASEDQRDASGDPAHTRRILAWYERPRQPELDAVAQRPPNAWGVHDMHGLIWEWVSDFNASMTGGSRRGSTERVMGLFCGGAAVDARSPDDYAAFMRYAFRSSLHGAYVMHSLGFRCAYDIEDTP